MSLLVHLKQLSPGKRRLKAARLAESLAPDLGSLLLLVEGTHYLL
jgi:hypothetical protein